MTCLSFRKQTASFHKESLFSCEPAIYKSNLAVWFIATKISNLGYAYIQGKIFKSVLTRQDKYKVIKITDVESDYLSLISGSAIC